MMHQRQRRAGHVDALPQRQRAEQRRLGVVGEALHQEPRWRRRPGTAPGCRAVRASISAAALAARIDENKPERPAARGGDQRGRSRRAARPIRSRRAPAAADGRRRRGCPPSRGRTANRRRGHASRPLPRLSSPHAEAIASNVPADGQRRRGEHRRRPPEQPAAQQTRHRKRCHPQDRTDAIRLCPSCSACAPSSWSSHTTSVRSGMAATNADRMRVAVSLTSVSAVTASARAEAALGRWARCR